MTTVTYKWLGEFDPDISIIGEFDVAQEFNSAYDEDEDEWESEFYPDNTWEGSS